VLLLVIMETISSYVGYRAWGDLVERHRSALIAISFSPLLVDSS